MLGKLEELTDKESIRALVLGLGGGTIAERLQRAGFIVDSVELDPRIAEIAGQYFGLELSGDLFIDDGRHFLRSTDRRYSLILFDVFQAEVPPVHLLTLAAFELAASRLVDDGLLVINYSGYLSGTAGRGARSILHTLQQTGLMVDLLPTGNDEHTSNNLFIASSNPLDYRNSRIELVIQDQRLTLWQRLLDPNLIDLSDAVLLVDDRPKLDRLNLEAARLWRETYYRHFTRPLHEQGLPLFE